MKKNLFESFSSVQNKKISLMRSLVIRQKGESQNVCFKKTYILNFPKNKHFLPADTHMYVWVSGGEK